MLISNPDQNGSKVIFRAGGGPEKGIKGTNSPQIRHVRGGIFVAFDTSGAPLTKEQAVTHTGAELDSANLPATDAGDTEAYGRARAQGDEATERACMVCGTKFESEGWHNRLCGSCRKRSAPLG